MSQVTVRRPCTKLDLHHSRLIILGGAVDLGENGIGVLVTLQAWALCPRSTATVMLPRLVEMLFANPASIT
jgi:hypothetical protein